METKTNKEKVFANIEVTKEDYDKKQHKIADVSYIP